MSLKPARPALAKAARAALEAMRPALTGGQAQPQAPAREPECPNPECTDGWDLRRDRECEQCRSRKQLVRLRDELLGAGVEPRYLEVEWEHLQMDDNLERIRKGCAVIERVIREGRNLALHGIPGAGKTQAATLMVKAAIRKGFAARIYAMSALVTQARAAWTAREEEERLFERNLPEHMARFRLLVLDGVGDFEAAGKADAQHNTLEFRLLYAVLNARQGAGLRTVITTNLTQKRFAEHFGPQVVSRLKPFSALNMVARDWRERETPLDW
ncbi:ATP-binding protein [Calidithermus chliarophilus]|uniref:ATP-binding protein n=1 Tax=Calidithermus chliarophilus TaxID=52023 RepID=UPI0003FF4790|nr:ATP-binding protein [Calidithermus chliarophilus]